MKKWRPWVAFGDEDDKWFDDTFEAETEEEAMKRAEEIAHSYITFGIISAEEMEES